MEIKFSQQVRDGVKKMRNEGATYREIKEKYGVSYTSICRYIGTMYTREPHEDDDVYWQEYYDKHHVDVPYSEEAYMRLLSLFEKTERKTKQMNEWNFCADILVR